VGTLLTGVFATSLVNPNVRTNLGSLLGQGLWLEQAKAMGIVVVLAFAGTAAITWLVQATVGPSSWLRV